MYSLYLTKLIELYKQARNIKTFNYYDSYQYKNFNEWLNNLKLCAFRYRKLLENQNIIDSFSNTIEIGKGENDTLTNFKDSALLITSYASTFRNVGNRIIIPGKLDLTGENIIVKLENNKGILTLYKPLYFLIQNPTKEEENLTYDLITHGYPVCFGVHSFNYELNNQKKLEVFHQLVDTSCQSLEVKKNNDLETTIAFAYTKKRR